MMDRIRQLEAECWHHRIDGILVDGQRHFDTRQFAELVVQECIKIVQATDKTQAHTTYDLALVEATMAKCVAQIKQHWEL